MRYPLAPLYCRPWTLNGITPRLIESHYEINYGGVVHRLNAISQELAALDPGATAPEVIHRLKRDEFVALNSMLLHELYFASLGGDGRAVPETMASALAQDFGSATRWRDEFVALATGLARAGSTGWVLLTYVPRDHRLINQLATDDGQMMCGAIPIRARYVRARLSYRFRPKRLRLHCMLHAQHRMEGGSNALQQRREG